MRSQITAATLSFPDRPKAVLDLLCAAGQAGVSFTAVIASQRDGIASFHLRYFTELGYEPEARDFIRAYGQHTIPSGSLGGPMLPVGLVRVNGICDIMDEAGAIDGLEVALEYVSSKCKSGLAYLNAVRQDGRWNALIGTFTATDGRALADHFTNLWGLDARWIPISDEDFGHPVSLRIAA
jgi:hypothetical protein